jgi:hypothetical protein
MATNKVFDDIFSGDHSERAVAFKNNIKSAIASFNANPSNIAHIRYLNSQYWDMVYFIVKKKVMSTGGLSFSESEKLAIDFGYISDELLGENKDITPRSLGDSVSVKNGRRGPVPCFSISKWLQEQLQDFLGINKLKEYEKKYEALVKLVDNLREEKRVVIESKKKLDEEFKNNTPAGISAAAAEKITAFNAIIDEALEKYGSLRSRIQNELLLKKNERVEFVTMENQIGKTRDERKKFYKSLPVSKSDYLANLGFLEDMIIQKEHEIFDNVTLIGKSRQKIEEFIYSKKEILDEEKDDFLKEKILAIKNIIEIISRTNKTDPVIFLTENPQENIPDELFDVTEKVMEFDPGLFENKKVKLYGRPVMILAPGKGRGDYDYHMNVLIIPHFPVKDYIDSMLNALALYRWECDDENKMKNSFSNLKSNKYYTSSSTLMQSFIKNYCVYMSKNIDGGGAVRISEFDFETRAWFTSYISRREADLAAVSEEEETYETTTADEIVEDKIEAATGKAPEFDEKITDGGLEVEKASESGESKEEPEEIKVGKADTLKPERKPALKLPGEFGNEPGDDAAEKTASPHGAAGRPRRSLKLPGEFDVSADAAEEVISPPDDIKQNGERPVKETGGDKVSPAAKEVSETISLLLKENSAIIKKRIQAIFKFDEVRVEPGKDHQLVNITISNLDANQVKHFLNLMSLQSKYYKFMSSIVKEEDLG